MVPPIDLTEIQKVACVPKASKVPHCSKDLLVARMLLVVMPFVTSGDALAPSSLL